MTYNTRRQPIAWAATVRRSALRHLACGRSADHLLPLQRDDLRAYPRRGPSGRLLVLLLDASGSMAAWQRMRTVKAAVQELLRQGYRRRDRIALVAFGGGGARLLVPPERGRQRLAAALEALPVGGGTPLAHGLAFVRRLIEAQRRREPKLSVWTVILTDGRCNVAFGPGPGDPWQQALAQARAVVPCAGECLVVDTDVSWPHLGRAAELARVLGADYRSLDEVMTPAARWQERSA